VAQEFHPIHEWRDSPSGWNVAKTGEHYEPRVKTAELPKSSVCEDAETADEPEESVKSEIGSIHPDANSSLGTSTGKYQMGELNGAQSVQKVGNDDSTDDSGIDNRNHLGNLSVDNGGLKNDGQAVQNTNNGSGNPTDNFGSRPDVLIREREVGNETLSNPHPGNGADRRNLPAERAGVSGRVLVDEVEDEAPTSKEIQLPAVADTAHHDSDGRVAVVDKEAGVNSTGGKAPLVIPPVENENTTGGKAKRGRPKGVSTGGKPFQPPYYEWRGDSGGWKLVHRPMLESGKLGYEYVGFLNPKRWEYFKRFNDEQFITKVTEIFERKKQEREG